MSVYIWGERVDPAADKAACDGGTLAGVDTSGCTAWAKDVRLLIEAPDRAKLAELFGATGNDFVGDCHQAWAPPYPVDVADIQVS